MNKKISLKLPKPRATILNKILVSKAKKSGRMTDRRQKRLQSKLKEELFELETE